MGIQFIELCISIFLCHLFLSRRLYDPSLFNKLMIVVVFVISVALLGSMASEMIGAPKLGDWINGIISTCLFACSAVAVIVAYVDVVDENSKRHGRMK